MDMHKKGIEYDDAELLKQTFAYIDCLQLSSRDSLMTLEISDPLVKWDMNKRDNKREILTERTLPLFRVNNKHISKIKFIKQQMS